MDVQSFVTLGLGDNSFLVGSGDEAVLVDPQRDAWRFVAEAERRGWRIRHVLETHVHNDYVSGALEARAATGAEIVVAAGSGPFSFDHRAIEPGDEVRIGDLRLVARAAPGHTFQHIAWEAWSGSGTAGAANGAAPAPEALFSGGSLLVGSAGRTDLLGQDVAEELARHQYRTIRELARLPDAVQLMPTHGAGSFCVSSPPSADRVSTIGAERIANGALLARDEDTFVREQLASLGRFPAYYPRIAPINRGGPPVLGAVPAIRELDPAAVERAVAGGAWVVDGRDRNAFAEAHLPGSINIELNEAFASYVGWIIPYDAPVVLVLPDPVDASAPEAAMQFFRIGREALVGQLAGGVEAWAASGRPTRSYPTAGMKDLFELVRSGERANVLDVRQPPEWREEGTIPGSRTIFVADLAGRIAELPAHAEQWVVCSSGHRAAIGASLLERAGVPVRLVSRGGVIGWVERFERLAASRGAGSPPASAASVGA